MYIFFQDVRVPEVITIRLTTPTARPLTKYGKDF